jgi:hypothetical protein
MENIGMRHSEDFDHPRFAGDRRLERHVLYRLSRSGAEVFADSSAR